MFEREQNIKRKSTLCIDCRHTDSSNHFFIASGRKKVPENQSTTELSIPNKPKKNHKEAELVATTPDKGNPKASEKTHQEKIIEVSTQVDNEEIKMPKKDLAEAQGREHALG